MTAIVLSLFLIVLTFAGLILGGGVSGLADTIAASGISSGELLFQGLMWIVISLLGTGLAIRRSHDQVLARLGLRLPTRQDIGVGIAAGLILFGLEIIVSAIWTALTPADQLAAQTAAAQQIGLAINTLPLALIVSITSAVGEEIFFRGAIQPVFGIVLTSIFFAVIHTQYALTPATALIFVIALVLGWLRRRYSTSTSIIAHFIYNFVPLTLAILFGASIGGV
jgi:membrane protease YdiL (CAAX protease family)